MGGGHGDAAGLQPGRGGTGTVDGVHDEDDAGIRSGHQAPVLGIVGDPGVFLQAFLHHGFGHLVDGEGGVAAGPDPLDVSGRGPAHVGAHYLADAQGQVFA